MQIVKKARKFRAFLLFIIRVDISNIIRLNIVNDLL